MEKEEADAIITQFIKCAPAWIKKAKRVENLTKVSFCLICGLSSAYVERLSEAIKLKIKNNEL
jgi:hypothetical protein